MPLALCLIDHSLTLFGQPNAYWRGEPAAVNEISPEARRLLMIGVVAATAGAVLWLAAVAALLLLLPQPAALFVALGVTIGHTVGAATWLWGWATGGYQAGLGLCLVAALGLTLTITWEESTRPPPDIRADRWRWVRWPVVAVVAAVPVYAFLWPH
jgi:hypothetical protein